jgi:hypothetical protein
MNDERPRTLKQKWDADDVARHKEEKRAQQLFLEKEASHTFAPIEDFLAKVRSVLGTAGAAMEIDPKWEHLSERRVRRVAKVISSNPPRQLCLEFTIQGVSIFYHDKMYRFTGGLAALIPAIAADVEQFLTPHRPES